MAIRTPRPPPTANIFGPDFHEREKQGAAILNLVSTLLDGRKELILAYLVPFTDAEQDDGKYDCNFQLVAIVHGCDTDWWDRLAQDMAALGHSVQIVTHVFTSLADIYSIHVELSRGIVRTSQRNGEVLRQRRECAVVINKLGQNLPFIVSSTPMVA